MVTAGTGWDSASEPPLTGWLDSEATPLNKPPEDDSVTPGSLIVMPPTATAASTSVPGRMPSIAADTAPEELLLGVRDILDETAPSVECVADAILTSLCGGMLPGGEARQECAALRGAANVGVPPGPSLHADFD